jgi:hypothetical protein
MAIATREEKQQVVEALKNSNKKYAKPFEKGTMAQVSFFGGNWEEYAAIVMNMVVADTLLDIDKQLEQLNSTMAQLLASLQSVSQRSKTDGHRSASTSGRVGGRSGNSVDQLNTRP